MKAALAVVVIVGATLAAYLPALDGGILWDDAAHITAMPLRTWEGLWRIWFQVGATQQYYPVLHSAFWIEHRLWGDAVFGYHAVNVALHAGAACLFALVLARIRPGTGSNERFPGAEWLAAAVFALHPICAESVAWISEQKNTLSLVFYLLSALAYLRFDQGRRPSLYFLALLLFVMAVLSKSVTSTLPAALLLVIAWRRGRLSWGRDVAPLVPWLAVGVGAGLFTAWVEKSHIGAAGDGFRLSFIERAFLAGRVVWFYLGKLLWPANLTFIYPRWTVVADWKWAAGALGVTAMFGFFWMIRAWSRAPLVASLFFVGSLFPALGFFNAYPFLFSYVADHFQYLACLGVIALVAEGGARLAWQGNSALRSAFAVAAVGVLCVLFTLTRRQASNYRDAVTLYSANLAQNPASWMSHNNLGVTLMNGGHASEAISHLEAAVRLRPDFADAHYNLGNALSSDPSRAGEAVTEYRTALGLEPRLNQARANLGRALAASPGGLSEGIDQLEAAVHGDLGGVDAAELHALLGALLSKVPGRLNDALVEFEAALRIEPEAAQVRDAFAVALARAGRPLDAVAEFERALQANPNNPEFHNNLGGVLMQLGRGSEAIAQYRTAIGLNPDFLPAHVNLGQALRNQGDGNEAVNEFQQALRLAPASADIMNKLGSAYFRQGKIQEAAAEYAEAVRLQPDSALFRNNLGLALTHEGRIDEAIDQLRRAVALVPGYADAHYNLGRALRRAGHDDAAAAEFLASGRPE
ncbi:MAG TPA: tetratricopeptide repeat protein [Opitutaceae bacterium]